MQLRICKYATKSVILDVSSALNYHKTNKYNEEEYKRSIQFLIHQYTKEKQAKAFLPKTTTKMVMNAIINHKFPQLFPNGITNYGGSPRKKLARIFTIKFDQEQRKYFLQITEGDGQMTSNGAIKMVNKEKNAVAYIPYEDTLKIAHEVLDFISQTEIIAMLKGRPLYTILPNKQYQTN